MSDSRSDKDTTPSPADLPEIARASRRYAAVLVDAPHPAVLAEEDLLSQCELRTQRRSGPGGQHRNKTSSGAYLLHRSSGVIGEATERRSQAQNRGVALLRLRYRLAVALRTSSIWDRPAEGAEAAVREKYHRHALKLSDTNRDKPAVLALVLNDLHAAAGQPRLVAPQWGATTSSVVSLLRSHRPAFTLANAVRRHHGRPPLK